MTGAPMVDSDTSGGQDAAETPPLFAPPPAEEQERMVEAMLFASAAPLGATDLAARMPHGCDVGDALARLRRRYAGRGVHLVRVGEAYAFRTAPDLGALMHHEVTETRKPTRAALETLAIVAYHQPVTRAEIEEIRGVAVSRGTLDHLMELGWIRLGRRRLTPGRPVTFVVTEGFLDHFGLETAQDLPGMKELRAAGLLDNRAMPGALKMPDDESDPGLEAGDDEADIDGLASDGQSGLFSDRSDALT